MATVRFAGALEGAPDLVVEVAGPERLLDVCDANQAPVAFSCRGATCATCRIAVLEGEDLLEPASEAERELLATLGSPSTDREGDPAPRPPTRLACQAVIRPTNGVIRLRWGS